MSTVLVLLAFSCQSVPRFTQNSADQSQIPAESPVFCLGPTDLVGEWQTKIFPIPTQGQRTIQGIDQGESQVNRNHPITQAATADILGFPR